MDLKKILIVYASAGHGHEKAAKAIHEACGGELIDTIRLAPGFFGALYRDVYLFQIKHLPWLWGFFYYSLDLSWVYFFMKYIRRLLNACTMQALERRLIEENASWIVCAHFTVIEVASHLKKAGKISSKIAVVVTDYYPHYVWTAPGVDIYFVAGEETKRGLVKRGVAADKVLVSGIPIENKFSLPVDADKMREALNLKPLIFTGLVTSGGAGIGAMSEIALQIMRQNPGMQLMVVCGTNQVLYKSLEAQQSVFPNLRLFGFVNNMHELMEAADVVIGKGGGLTVTESFAKARPVVLFRPVPGQEARNAHFVRKHEAGFATNNLKALTTYVSRLAKDPVLLDQLRVGVRQVSRPRAAQEIAEHLQ